MMPRYTVLSDYSPEFFIGWDVPTIKVSLYDVDRDEVVEEFYVTPKRGANDFQGYYESVQEFLEDNGYRAVDDDVVTYG